MRAGEVEEDEKGKDGSHGDPVQRGRVQSQSRVARLFTGDKSKIMSAEESPRERITASSIRPRRCCFRLRLTGARMKCLRFL